MSWFSQKVKLPLWLKMVGMTKKESTISQETTDKIVKALKENKSVICLQNGEPIRIKSENGKVVIEPITDYAYDFR